MFQLNLNIYYYLLLKDKFVKFDTLNHLKTTVMKKIIRNSALMIAAAFMLSSCIGSFQLTNKVKDWNESLGDKFINEVVFLAFHIVPVYEVAYFADVVVLNTIEFWTGSNPVASNEVKEVDDKTAKMLLKHPNVEEFVAVEDVKNLEDEIIDIKNKNRLDYVSFEQKIESIKSHHLYKKLYDISTNSTIKTNTSYPDLQLNNLEQKELIELFNATFDNSFSKIISKYNGLKYYDLLYFCLYIIGFDEKHISAVTGKTYNAVWNRTKKIQEIFEYFFIFFNKKEISSILNLQ